MVLYMQVELILFVHRVWKSLLFVHWYDKSIMVARESIFVYLLKWPWDWNRFHSLRICNEIDSILSYGNHGISYFINILNRFFHNHNRFHHLPWHKIDSTKQNWFQGFVICSIQPHNGFHQYPQCLHELVNGEEWILESFLPWRTLCVDWEHYAFSSTSCTTRSQHNSSSNTRTMRLLHKWIITLTMFWIHHIYLPIITLTMF